MSLDDNNSQSSIPPQNFNNQNQDDQNREFLTPPQSGNFGNLSNSNLPNKSAEPKNDVQPAPLLSQPIQNQKENTTEEVQEENKIEPENQTEIQAKIEDPDVASNLTESAPQNIPAAAASHHEEIIGVPTRPARVSSDKKIHSEFIFHVEIEKIKPNPHQPRRDFDEESLKELAVSIREFGILQPLVVSKIEKETDFGADVEYVLIAGERRLRAAKLLGLERVPVIIRSVTKDAENLEMAIVENLQRSDLNPVETARAYAKLQDVFGLTQREIAARLGKSRETVANSLRLLNLPKEIQDALVQGKINESQARLLLTIDEAPTQKALLQDLLNNNLSVRELRGRIKKNPSPSDRQNNLVAGHESFRAVDPEILSFQEQLTELLGAQVKIEKTDKSGKIIISFYSPEEIQGIIKKLSPGG